tara:strand:+ start:497 stop:679 length:183 start_codon:yes stop_codon:yes gene_type:complete
MNINTVQKVIDETTNQLDSYKVTLVGDNETRLCVPLEPANRHYQAIQEWVAEGNTIQEAE